MSTISIYGASDDLVEVEIDGKAWDEFSEPRSFVFTAAGKALHVSITHGKGGWAIAVRIEDEEESGTLPFGVSIEQRDYSPILTVTTGAEPVTFLWFDEEKQPRTRTFK